MKSRSQDSRKALKDITCPAQSTQNAQLSQPSKQSKQPTQHLLGPQSEKENKDLAVVAEEEQKAKDRAASSSLQFADRGTEKLKPLVSAPAYGPLLPTKRIQRQGSNHCKEARKGHPLHPVVQRVELNASLADQTIVEDQSDAEENSAMQQVPTQPPLSNVQLRLKHFHEELAKRKDPKFASRYH